MFDEIIKEVNRLTQPRRISISLPLDEKGFFDRACPNKECRGAFKVLFEDWRDKVSDARVFCPFCRHEAPADQWSTEEQIRHIKSVAGAQMIPLVNEAFRRGVARTQPVRIGRGPIGISMSLDYRPGPIPAVVPAMVTDALRQEFTCETCGCRYASLGASFFCPACGHNSAASSFDNTLETVRNAVLALGPLRVTLQQTVNPDAAQDAARQLLEDQFPRLVGAFECLNEALFEKLPNASKHPRTGNVFQRVDDASMLWQLATGKGYGDFLLAAELQRMRLLFQRRHVLSHRQGLVDENYIDRSGDTTYAVGQRLVVRDADVLELADLLGKLAASLKTLF